MTLPQPGVAIVLFWALCAPHSASAMEQEQLHCAASLVAPADLSASFKATRQAALVISNLYSAEARRTRVEAGLDMDALDAALDIGDDRSNCSSATYSESQWRALEAALPAQLQAGAASRNAEVACARYIITSHAQEQRRRNLP